MIKLTKFFQRLFKYQLGVNSVKLLRLQFTVQPLFQRLGTIAALENVKDLLYFPFDLRITEPKVIS